MPKSKSKSQSQSQTQLSSPATTVNEVKVLQAEVARLQVQLKNERLRAEAYDEMIHVAESKFKIAIRKKAGAKR